jgi:hypothetical protein
MKSNAMQQKYLLRALLILLLIAGSYLVLWSATNTGFENKACSESMEECCQKKGERNSSGDMLWESLPHQFISTSLIGN